MGEALRVEGLTKRFGDFTAVQDLTFHIEAGEIFGFLGPNGAGKSTTIRMLCGVLRPTSGAAWALGCDLFTQAEAVRARMGYMSQKFSLLHDLTVMENLVFFGSLYGLSTMALRQESEHRLRELQMTAFRDTLVASLSTGEKQRVALAASTLHHPEVLFLDEPTSGVDPLRRRLFWEAMDTLVAEGMTILVTTHNLAEADQCDRLAFILGGRLMAYGRPQDLKTAMGLQLVVLRTEAYREVQAAAARLEGVHAAVLQGRSVRLALAAEAAPEPILARLHQDGFSFEAAPPALPSLEDLFVDLVIQDRARS